MIMGPGHRLTTGPQQAHTDYCTLYKQRYFDISLLGSVLHIQITLQHELLLISTKHQWAGAGSAAISFQQIIHRRQCCDRH